ncbi:MAG: Na+/H+ antiporter [Thermoleophilia bacterium]|nr:Na+/H+ antiporter [Thermoleophilia bacterium]
MDALHPSSIEWLLAAGVFSLAALATLAQSSRLPYPIFLVLAGLAIGFVPGVPTPQLDPDVVFLVFLPPLIYAAAYFTSLRELERHASTISVLAVGLVVATMVAVAVVVHALVPDMSWAVAFTLGAIVSPTDPVAGSAVLERMQVPRAVMHIVEGESLINDGSGIVLYRVAVAAVVTGTFSIADAGVEFLTSVVGGVAVGVVVGAVMTFLRRRNEHGSTDVLLSVLSGYAAYLPAEALHVSGVLAVATASIWLGWRTPTIVRDAETRLQINALWTNLNFVLNAVLFLLVGLQMHGILDRLHGVGAGQLVWWGAATAVTVMVTRLVFIFPTGLLPGLLSKRLHDRQGRTWRGVLLAGWIGMRGAVSLAAALALPVTIHGDTPFPHRDLLVYLTFCVIMGTLLVQGLTLGRIVDWLELEDDGSFARSESHARMVAASAAVAHIESLDGVEWIEPDSLERLRRIHDYRERRFAAHVHDTEELERFEQRAEAWVRASHEVQEVQRGALVRLRDEGEITDEVMHLVQRDLDLEDVRLS